MIRDMVNIGVSPTEVMRHTTKCTLSFRFWRMKWCRFSFIQKPTPLSVLTSLYRPHIRPRRLAESVVVAGGVVELVGFDPADAPFAACRE
jgi:hypothetical protein